jgi:hypothetical protein
MLSFSIHARDRWLAARLEVLVAKRAPACRRATFLPIVCFREIIDLWMAVATGLARLRCRSL